MSSTHSRPYIYRFHDRPDDSFELDTRQYQSIPLLANTQENTLSTTNPAIPKPKPKPEPNTNNTQDSHPTSSRLSLRSVQQTSSLELAIFTATNHESRERDDPNTRPYLTATAAAAAVATATTEQDRESSSEPSSEPSSESSRNPRTYTNSSSDSGSRSSSDANSDAGLDPSSNPIPEPSLFSFYYLLYYAGKPSHTLHPSRRLGGNRIQCQSIFNLCLGFFVIFDMLELLVCIWYDWNLDFPNSKPGAVLPSHLFYVWLFHRIVYDLLQGGRIINEQALMDEVALLEFISVHRLPLLMREELWRSVTNRRGNTDFTRCMAVSFSITYLLLNIFLLVCFFMSPTSLDFEPRPMRARALITDLCLHLVFQMNNIIVWLSDPRCKCRRRRKRVKNLAFQIRKGKYKCLDDNEGNELECAICLTEFGVEDDILMLKCNHFYHELCLTKWLREHESCPLCRRNL